MDIEAHLKIQEAIATNNAVIFLGTGISTYTTNREQDCAHWVGLLKHGLIKCHELERVSDKTFNYFIKKFDHNEATIEDYLRAADVILESLKMESDETKTDAFKEWLKETVGSLKAKNTDVIKAIGALDCPIFTTNYDALLEQVLEKKPLTWKKYLDVGIGDSFSNLKNYILHVHGYYEEPSSVVFTKQSYTDILGNEFAQGQLRAMMATKTCLFIGYGAGLSDPNFSNLLEWKYRVTGHNGLPIYKVIKADKKTQLEDTTPFENIKTIVYGMNTQDLIPYLKSLKPNYIPQEPTIQEKTMFEKKDKILKKYLNYLIDEYSYVSIFGYSKSEFKLPLSKVYVDLKFDSGHPSIKAMKIAEITEEFKRKLFTSGFFDENEKFKIYKAYSELCKKTPQNINNLYKNFMMEQWLNVLLDNKTIFTKDEAAEIKSKITKLRRQITEQVNLPKSESCEIQKAYDEFRHFIILGHPGSGKTTISKWMVVNMAKQLLGEPNSLFVEKCKFKTKLPILIPIWKYVAKLNENKNHKTSLLQFIYENPTLDSKYFEDDSEKQLLIQMFKEYLVMGDALVILEGLDEIPIYMDRSDLMKEINALIEKHIDFDHRFNKLSYSVYDHKEVCITYDNDVGNRFIVTSRIEGNYFQEINLNIPRLTIEDMSNQALEAFCSSYMESIKDIMLKSGRMTRDYDVNQLYKDIKKNEDIFKLAINPQLASLISSIYNQYDGELPNKRIDLYEKAIERMIERLVNLFSSSDKPALKNFTLNRTIVWSIMQEIADYLHYRTEGLTEDALKEIIKKCLLEFYKQTQTVEVAFEDIMIVLVDIFKVHSGLLSEFGQNSFKFLHRTFQEYLAARNIVYLNGIERDENIIYENIKNKIAIPNWRVPLNMAFGILSKSMNNNKLFENIIERLFQNDTSSDNNASTFIVPFVIVDSLNDMSLPTKDKEHELIKKVSETFLADYKNTTGFSRLREHKELIEGYFSKLKESNEKFLSTWFSEKLEIEENISACASILFQLKWYEHKYHEVFLKNLHNDSKLWNWPIDSVLRYYATLSEKQMSADLLKMKHMIHSNEKYNVINKNQNLLRFMATLYGGYKNYDTSNSKIEYYEIASFLQLSDYEREPFIFYYQEIWGKDDPAYQMAVYLDNHEGKKYWNETLNFDKDIIYKDCFLTDKLLSMLNSSKPHETMKNELIDDIKSDNLLFTEKIEALLALIALGEYEFIKSIFNDLDDKCKKGLKIRIEQLITNLKDPLARCSSRMSNYLVNFQMTMKEYPMKYPLKLKHYLKLFLSLNAESGGAPVSLNDMMLVTGLSDSDQLEENLYLCAEQFVETFTGENTDDQMYATAVLCDNYNGKFFELVKSFLEMSKCVQMYKPVRSYLWAMDLFNFKNTDPNDIPIGFINILENLNRNMSMILDWVTRKFCNDDLYEENPDLIPIMVLLNFGSMAKDSDDLLDYTYQSIMPELAEEKNIKEALLKKIESIENVYYKSRSLCKLALYYESKSFELFKASIELAHKIEKANLKFQVLELIYSTLMYKDFEEHEKQTERKNMLKMIIEDLERLVNNIEDPHDKVIANVRLSFYFKGNDRNKHLGSALDVLSKMEENDDKIDLVILLKPLVNTFNELDGQLKKIVSEIKNGEAKAFISGQYGKILFNLTNAVAHETETQNTHIDAIYTIYAQLNDVKLLFEEKDNLWKGLLENPDDHTKIEEIVEIGLKSDLILTHQAAIVIDEIVQKGKESSISMIFPYLVKPPNEVLPIVYRWFIDRKNPNIRNLAAVLLVEHKFLFAASLDNLKNVLKCEHDQLRYRAQSIFQHPSRDPKKPEKRISVIGESTIFKIFENLLTNEHVLRVVAYVKSFFYNVLWDDPEVYLNLAKKIAQLKAINPATKSWYFLSYIKFSDAKTWNAIIESLDTVSYPSFYKEILLAAAKLIYVDQINSEEWDKLTKILISKGVDASEDELFFMEKDIILIRFIVDNTKYFIESEDLREKSIKDYIEERIASEIGIKLGDILKPDVNINHFAACNFYVSSSDFNSEVINFLNGIQTDMKFCEVIIEWLIQNLRKFNGFSDSHFSLMILDILLSLAAALVQKDDFIYRKITNSETFNKVEFTKLLEKSLNNHPYFPARGCSFILLAAIDKTDHSLIMNALNTLLDENVVKSYSVIAIPMIQLADEFTEDLLKVIKTESAVKAYEVLKILTENALNDKIDAFKKSKILSYLMKEIKDLKSKKPVNFYTTDIKIPFTTTLEKELYKAWMKIQGLSGKAEYNTKLNKLETKKEEEIVETNVNQDHIAGSVHSSSSASSVVGHELEEDAETETKEDEGVKE